jgi:hypothetical protein
VLVALAGAHLDTMTIEMAEDLKETKWLTCVKQLLRLTKALPTFLINHLYNKTLLIVYLILFFDLAQIATSVLLTDEPLVVRGVAKNIYEHQITALTQICLGS